MTHLAPVAIFIFNRPDHLRRTLTSLRQCEGFKDSPLVVFGDGPRNEAERPQVVAARNVAYELLGKGADYRFSDVNNGLAQSIIGGVSEVVQKHGRIIVIEDDFDLATNFLTFMNAALNHYVDCLDVYQVSGYMFHVPEFRERKASVILPLTSTWGWATWRRAWQYFDTTAEGWRDLFNDTEMSHKFNFGGVYDYASMMRRQMEGKVDSWGIRWYWSVFQQNGLVVCPPRSLLRNIGMDGSGTHGGGTYRRFDHIVHRQVCNTIELSPVVLERDAIEAVRRAVWRQNGGWLGFGLDRVRSIFDSVASISNCR